MDENLISRATEIAKANKSDFGCSLLKKELHIGILTSNEILDELVNRGIITINPNSKYPIEVLV